MSEALELPAHPLLEGLILAEAGLDAAAGHGARRVWQLSTADTGAALVRVRALAARLAAVETALVAHAEAVAASEELGSSSMARWLSARLGVTLTEANQMARDAELFTRQPRATRLLAQGRVGVDHARVLAQALDAIDALEGVDDEVREQAAGFLDDQAVLLTPRELSRAATHLIETLTVRPSSDDPNEAQAVAREADRLPEDRWIRVLTAADGTSSGRWRGLDPIGTAALVAFLHHAGARPAGAEGVQAADASRDAQAPADASAADASRDGKAPAGASVTDTRNRAQRQLDAFSTLVRLALSAAEPQGRDGARRPLLVVTADYDVLSRRLRRGVLETGQPIPDHMLRRVACDAEVLPAVLGGASVAIDLGRTQRLFTSAQRRALQLRDGGCTFPGCSASPRQCEAHHMEHWESGGLTNLDNGALVCDYHHDRAHREGWTARLASNGHVGWAPPAAIDPSRRIRQHHRYRLAALGRSRT